MYEVDQHCPQLEEEGAPTRQVTEHRRVAVPQEVARTYVQEHGTSLSQSTLDLDDLHLLIRKKLKSAQELPALSTTFTCMWYQLIQMALTNLRLPRLTSSDYK